MTYQELLNILEDRLVKENLDPSGAKIIFSEFLKCDYTKLVVKYYHKEVDENTQLKLENLVSEYIHKRVLEYVTHNRYFFGLNIYVEEGVLVPRFETEELVALVLKQNKEDNLKVLDLCCGSGCIGLALKNRNHTIDLTLSDIDDTAIKVAKKNAKKLKLEAKVIKSDFLSKIDDSICFDIITCNPPYIYRYDEEVDINTRGYEPDIALYTNDKEGLDAYKTILSQLLFFNFKKCYFEIGHKQKENLIKLLSQYNYKYEFYKDIDGKDRI